MTKEEIKKAILNDEGCLDVCVDYNNYANRFKKEGGLE